MKLEEAIQQKIDSKTKPPGSLGRLEELALKIASVQKTLEPEIVNPVLLVFAADHGLTEEKISPYPKEVTAQMVGNFLKGGAAINVFCRQNGLELKVIDAGVDFDFEPSENLIIKKIRRGTSNMLKGPAMTIEECTEAMKRGADIIEEINAMGCNIVAFGEMGIGNTSSAALLMHKLCHYPLDLCVGRGTGLDDHGLNLKLKILKRVAEKHNSSMSSGEILSTFGGFEIAMMTGAMLKARELNMIMLIDGFIVTSALLAAHNMENNICSNCIFCHESNEQGHHLMLDYLKGRPLLKLGMCLGEGTGAAIALPLIKAAVNFLNEMASFESAGISNKL